MFTTLISIQQLSSEIASGGNDLVVLDCRFNLMNPAQGEQLYLEGHIPGAVYIDLDRDLSSPITDQTGRHPLPDYDHLAERLRQSGVSFDSQVVVYDDCAGAMAGRAWWLLKVLGHTAVAVLDGGYPAWHAAALPVTAEPGSVVLGNFSANIDNSMIVTVSEIESDDQGKQLIDARTVERFRGEQEPIDPVAGHIPGAINRPLQLNLTEAGLFKSAAQLKHEWQALLAGRNPDQIIHYCGSGVTACHNYLAMEIAGLSGSQIYAGSWSEWIRDPKRTIAANH